MVEEKDGLSGAVEKKKRKKIHTYTYIGVQIADGGGEGWAVGADEGAQGAASAEPEGAHRSLLPI
jgi:hypothetical protein